MHATDFLRKPGPAEKMGFVVLHGNERHLKSAALKLLSKLVLGNSEDNIGMTRFQAKDVDFKTVRDELQMISMFSSRKIVLLEDAEDFVTKFRSQLESYGDKPASRSTLILDLKSWRKNTRLYKAVDATGLEIDCSELVGARLTKWVTTQSKSEYQKELSSNSAELLISLVGQSLSQLDQELVKLSTYVGERHTIEDEDVRKLVGGWKGETTWSMIDAIRDGHPDQALYFLNKLLYSGEAGPKILGGLNFTFRKIAIATEQSRKGISLTQALRDAGVFPNQIPLMEKYLRRIKRPRAEKLLETLAQADFGLKGGSRFPEKLQLEQLVLWLCGVEFELNEPPLLN